MKIKSTLCAVWWWGIMKQYCFWRNILHIFMHIHFYEIFLQRFALLMTKCFWWKSIWLKIRNASPETSLSQCTYGEGCAMQYKAYVAFGRTSDFSRWWAEPSTWYAAKGDRTEEGSRNESVHCSPVYGAPRFRRRHSATPPSLHGVNRVGFWGREMRVMFAVHRNECLEFYTLVAT